MADKGTSNISVSVFMDDIKSSMSGDLDYTPVSGDDDAWIFAEVAVGASGSIAILDTSDSYLGLAAAVSLSDLVKWVAIKNISTTSTEGVGICIDDGAAAYNDSDIMVIGNGEMLVMKTPNLTVGHLNARTCTLDSDGKPSSQGTATVTCQVAAILEDV
jgi:hypothetical protein